MMGDASRGYLYSGSATPAPTSWRAVVAELEGAEAALCFASGMAAISAAVSSCWRRRGRWWCAAAQLYGQTYHCCARPRPDDAVRRHRRHGRAARAPLEGAGLLVCETVSNPSLAVADIPAVAEVAHAAGARLVVDNTIATPIGCRPLDARRRPRLPLGHQVPERPLRRARRRGRRLGRADRQPRRSARSTWAPRSRPTPPGSCAGGSARCTCGSSGLRERDGDRHASWRATRGCGGCSTPACASHPSHDVARRILEASAGCMSFEVEGGRPGAEAVMDRVELCVRATSLGGVETCISHPASTSHRQLSAAELAEAGYRRGRLSG